jgi:hypothetical protein
VGAAEPPVAELHDDLIALGAPPAELAAAVDRRLAECLRYAGFEYKSGPDLESAPNLFGIIGMMTEESARKVGYAAVATSGERSPQESYVASLAPSDAARYAAAVDPEHGPQAVVRGDHGEEFTAPRQGCYAQARTAVYGSVENFLRLMVLPTRVRLATPALFDHDSVRDAAAQYGRCMTGRGYPTSNLKHMRELAEARFGRTRSATDPPGDEEVTMALADAACQESSKLIEVITSAGLAEAAPWIASHAGEIQMLATVQTESTARAEVVLRRGSSRSRARPTSAPRRPIAPAPTVRRCRPWQGV